MAAPTAVVFNKMVELGLGLGVRSIKDFSGVWFQLVDKEWCFAINGHEEEMDAAPEGGMRVNVAPFEAAVWRNGWLIATLSPYGGVFLGDGEDQFINALDQAIAKSA